ncbi:lantibiotic dehydratase [Streptomyces longispororuber]|uniref:Lantibiotic dehydratase n=1 Tax=Streptomyces longispororuber TaxID=68230 RepID=A0A919A3X4_9ACTN|nr:lantibiotic dehydratase [Streptomyces longispororuber]
MPQGTGLPRDAVPAGNTELPSDADLVAAIRGMMRHDDLREAVEVSSASLMAMVEKVESGAPVPRKRLLSSAVSLTRYALRSAGRPTPFGLQAGVAPAATGTRSRFAWSGEHRKATRVDAGWFTDMVMRHLDLPAVRHRMEVVTNDLCTERGDRLVLPYVTAAARAGGSAAAAAGQEVSLRRTPVLRWALDTARRPVTYAALLDAAGHEFPAVPATTLDDLLLRLVRCEVLLTELSTATVDEALLDRTLDLLSAVPEDRAAFTEVREALAAYADEPVGSGGKEWQRAVTAARRVQESPHPVAQVDLRVGADVTLPDTVLREAERCATALWRMSPDDGRHPEMRAYYEAFVERYGEGGAARLPELVDPHRGLGFPAGYRNPRAARNGRLLLQANAVKEHGDPRRQAVMADLIQQGILRPDREVVLDEEAVRRLSTGTGTGTGTPPPPSLELCLTLLADSVENLDSGDFRLLVSPMLGSTTAGASMGRFAELAGIVDEVGRLMPHTRDGDGVTAHLTFRPRSARSLNVSQVPLLAPYALPVGHFPRGTGPALDWRELLVTADEERLRLVCGRTGREVHPVVPHKLNLHDQAPNVARLLNDLRHTGRMKKLQLWDWAGYGASPWLPRVRMGRVVLSPLTWNPGPELRDSAAARPGWDDALDHWRRRYAVPDRVCVTRADQVYELDLRDGFQREMFRRDLGKGQVTVVESPRDLGSYGWCGDRANEVVVPLIGTPGPRAGTRAGRERHRSAYRGSRPVVSTAPMHSPGGDWQYAQLLAAPEAHDHLIGALDPLVRRIAPALDQWFFSRYYAPEPQVRLRLRPASPQEGARVRALLCDHLERLRGDGLLRQFALTAYEPETARYGGATALAAAEPVFCLDSRLALTQLTLLTAGRSPLTRAQLIVANHALLLESLGPWAWLRWAGAAFPRSTDGTVTRQEIQEASRLVVPGETADRLGHALGLRRLRETWQGSGVVARLGDRLQALCDGAAGTRRRDVAVLSLLHMQHNRLVGGDLASEAKAGVLLGHVARARLDDGQGTRPSR